MRAIPSSLPLLFGISFNYSLFSSPSEIWWGAEEAYHQGASMQTVLVLLAVEIYATQLQDSPIVPPQKAAYDEIDEVSHDDHTPEWVLPEFERRELQEQRLIVIVFNTFEVKDREKNGATNHRECKKNIATHPREPHEYGSIHASMADEFFLSRIP